MAKKPTVKIKYLKDVKEPRCKCGKKNETREVKARDAKDLIRTGHAESANGGANKKATDGANS